MQKTSYLGIFLGIPAGYIPIHPVEDLEIAFINLGLSILADIWLNIWLRVEEIINGVPPH
jgi:hypothetical protein